MLYNTLYCMLCSTLKLCPPESDYVMGRSICQFSPLKLFLEQFINPGAGSGTSSIGGDKGGGWVGAVEDCGGC